MKNYFPLYKENIIKLTGNDRKVLRFLLKNGRISDVSMAESLKITPQATSKIRKKLESRKIIRNYSIDLNYPALGVNLFSLVLLEVLDDKMIIHPEKENIFYKNLISLYRVVKNGASHIAICGFRDAFDLNNYFYSLHLEHNDSIRVKKAFIFPHFNLIKHSTKDFFFNAIKNIGTDKKQLKMDIPYHKIEGTKKNEIKLNSNEKDILKFLVNDARMSYNKISLNLGEGRITNRAVSKIKDRLEKKGVIKGYSANIDYNKLGIGILAFLFLKKKPDYWKLRDGICKWGSSTEQIIGCYELSDDAMHVLLSGFKDINELEDYYHTFKLRNNDLFDIETIYISSSNGLIKDNYQNFFNYILN